MLFRFDALHHPSTLPFPCPIDPSVRSNLFTSSLFVLYSPSTSLFGKTLKKYVSKHDLFLDLVNRRWYGAISFLRKTVAFIVNFSRYLHCVNWERVPYHNVGIFYDLQTLSDGAPNHVWGILRQWCYRPCV